MTSTAQLMIAGGMICVEVIMMIIMIIIIIVIIIMVIVMVRMKICSLEQ